MAARRNGFRIFVVSAIVALCLALIAAVFLVKYANMIARAGIEKAMGKDFSIGSIELKWGSVRVHGVAMKDRAGKEVIRVGNLVVKASFMSLLRQKYVISSVLMEKPYIYVEIDRKGDLVSPVFPAGDEIARKAGRKAGDSRRPEGKQRPVILKKIVIVNGSVDYLDRKSPKVPVLTRVRSINAEVRNLTVPFTDDLTHYVLRAAIPEGRSTASVKSEGGIRFQSKDMECTAAVRELDITHFKPYYHGSQSINMTRGLLDLDVRAKIVSRRIHAPGKAVLKGLEFGSGHGLGDRFMGVPVTLVVAFLKKSGDQIPVDFVISGDLDNPKFNIAENFASRLSFSIAEKLGFSVKDIGESVFGLGTEGTKKIGESIEGIGEGIKKIFKR
ncbi:MAG TPA: DUF748 domain-containing protein [Syntrophorhabdaceae bacterium]|nr:DUF748 domain-containing protein [Syntrophorhabdaceae bacterium]HOD75665.1 DUF748 domain-containing protein [Syntrophorhabdaceae bacterium]